MNFFEVAGAVCVAAVGFAVAIPLAKWVAAPGWVAILLGIAFSGGFLYVLGSLTSHKKTGNGVSDPAHDEKPDKGVGKP